MLELLGSPGDVLELRIAVRMLNPLARLAIGLQAVAQGVQRLADGLMTHGVALARQLGGQGAHALAGPAQQRHRMASGRRLNKFLQRRTQSRVYVDHSRAAGTGTSHPMFRRHRYQLPRVTQFFHPRRDRRTRQADCPRHGGDTAIPESTSFRRRPKSAHLLIHHVTKRFVLLGNLGFIVIHLPMLPGQLRLVKVIC